MMKLKVKDLTEKDRIDNLIKIIVGFVVIGLMMSTLNWGKAEKAPEKDVIICTFEPGLFGIDCN